MYTTSSRKAAVAPTFVAEPLESRRLLASATFTWDPPPGTVNPHSLRFDIDQPQLPAQVMLSLTNLTTEASISPVTMTVGTWASGASAIFTFPAYSNGVVNGVLPDGNYYAVLVDRAQPPAQQVLLETEFFVFTGDANHDRTVNLQDFNALAANFGQSNKRFSEGDFNYDGTVNLQDFNRQAANFGMELSAPSVPIKLTGTPVSSDGVDKWWTALTGATEYRLEMSHDGVDFFDSVVLDTSSVTAKSADLAPNQATYFRVVGANSSGDLGTSNIVRATTFAADSLDSSPFVRLPQSPTPVEPPLDARGQDKLVVAFNGVYVNDPLDSDGNEWFEWIVREDGNSIKPIGQAQRTYNHHTSELDVALSHLLPRIDANGNQIITAAEIAAKKIIVMSYSWGVIPAGKLTIRLREDNITVQSGPGMALYHMEGGVDIPVHLLLTLDPVYDGPARVVRWINGKINNNVQKFINWYQRRGGTTTFGLWPPGTTNNGQNFNPFLKVGEYTGGTAFSSLLKGKALTNHVLPAANVTQVNLNTLGARYATNVDWLADPLGGVNHFDANLAAGGVEHTMLPWYLRGGIDGQFSADYNALRELANV